MSGNLDEKKRLSSKLFKALFKGKELQALPIVPLTQKFAARVGQVDPSLMWSDPSAMVNALLRTNELSGFDALVTNIELSGCQANNEKGGDSSNLLAQLQQKAKVAVEVTQRLRQMLKETKVLGCMTAGPLTLSTGEAGSCVWGDSFITARDLLLQFVKLMGESRIEFFMLHENGSNVPDNDLKDYVEQTRPLWNALRYYDVQPIFAMQCFSPHLVEALAPEVSGIAMTGNFFELDLAWLSRISEQKRVCIGLPLPGEIFMGRLDVLEVILARVAEQFNRRRVFLLSSGEIPVDAEIDSICKCLANCSDISGWK